MRDCEMPSGNYTVNPDGPRTIIVPPTGFHYSPIRVDATKAPCIVEQDGIRYRLPYGKSFTWPARGWRNRLYAQWMRVTAWFSGI